MTRNNLSSLSTLSVETVVTIHEHLVQEFAQTTDPVSPPGIRDEGLLISAVHRQEVGSGQALKYGDPCSNAASLMYGICNNHPFYNGNKRTALVAGLMHLDGNGLVLHDASRSSLYRLMLEIASHEIVQIKKSRRRFGSRPDADDEVLAITRWLHDKARKIKKGERSITFFELYRILERFGYLLGQKKHNKMEVLERRRGILRREKWVCVYKIPCPGDSRTVALNDVKDVREALKLTEVHGVDSESFYETQVIIDSFVRQHRNVLRKLAKT